MQSYTQKHWQQSLFPLSFHWWQNNKIFNYYNLEVVHKKRSFHSLGFNKHIFQLLCLGWWYHKGIFSWILFIYCCFGFGFVLHSTDISVQNFKWLVWGFSFFHQKNSRMWFMNRTQINKTKGSKFQGSNLIFHFILDDIY